ncbi:hypothetical protein A2257_01440 [Candidatus Falkowbacteria bacterium RIFOXYA2_FULL_38_12]|uniref:Uncharacterized protein n=1 Tax=Candidatus Falkowbacteria bacterium RIFOXYA2_FULL_38_12 TaxID=1797993 RepID=A0A1F5S389_9BACT|nr:MAG: hypothetical protein A2257_01440 [Candidatus Falkowbacteria bacterium RIFOXYA2_FULL_38_12]OGF44097.1 MAG: hypothetical protein A2555_04275 [Candidatus Falkowbacteria bacterium RIFOXYD2_FULL_39_16]
MNIAGIKKYPEMGKMTLSCPHCKEIFLPDEKVPCSYCGNYMVSLPSISIGGETGWFGFCTGVNCRQSTLLEVAEEEAEEEEEIVSGVFCVAS